MLARLFTWGSILTVFQAARSRLVRKYISVDYNVLLQKCVKFTPILNQFSFYAWAYTIVLTSRTVIFFTCMPCAFLLEKKSSFCVHPISPKFSLQGLLPEW